MPMKKDAHRKPKKPHRVGLGDTQSGEKTSGMEGGFVTMEGECRPGVCGNEAACRPFPNSTYTCVCPHDNSFPTPGLKCPIRVIAQDTANPIHNIIPPISRTERPIGGFNSTNSGVNATISEQASRSGRLSHASEISVLVGAFLLTGVLLGAFVMWWKRRPLGACAKNKRAKSGAPRDIKKDALLPERYTANPQYTVCAGSGGCGSTVTVVRREALNLLQEIGEGCFGKVFKGEFRKQEAGPETVAIKVLKATASREAEEDFLREVDIMSAFRHTHILTLVGVVNRDGDAPPWMVFEYMPYGDLTGVLRSNTRFGRAPVRLGDDEAPVLDRPALLSIAIQIAAGMRYLAAQRFVHRDLACRNCLVGSELTVKIADFGLSRDVYTCDYYKIGGCRLLPVRWMSPESVMYGRFTLESDVWSYGVVMWEIYSLGLQPYYGHNNEEVIKLIIQGIMLIPPDDCPSFICDLMRSCWKTEPKDRIRFPDIHDRLKLAQDNKEWTKGDNKIINSSTLPLPPKQPPVLSSAMSLSAEPPMLSTQTNMADSIPLPRPPVNLTVTELLDSEGYLLPQTVTPVDYMITIPD